MVMIRNAERPFVRELRVEKAKAKDPVFVIDQPECVGRHTSAMILLTVDH